MRSSPSVVAIPLPVNAPPFSTDLVRSSNFSSENHLKLSWNLVRFLLVSSIPFKDFRPTIRAKPVPIPLKFNSKSISQLQLLYSKFGTAGDLNIGFQAGTYQILLRSISAYI